MGYLLHGALEYEFEDRLLAHLKTVIGQKLKKHEGFYVSWTKSVQEGGGRMALWVSTATQLGFRFSGSRPPELNMLWITVMLATSHGNRGVLVIPEAEAESFARKNPDLI